MRNKLAQLELRIYLRLWKYSRKVSLRMLKGLFWTEYYQDVQMKISKDDMLKDAYKGLINKEERF